MKKNESLFKSKFKYSNNEIYNELSKLKSVTDYISKNENYNIIRKIFKNDKNLANGKENIQYLNKKIFENINLKILHNISLIKEIKDSKITNFNDICYELYLTPDSSKIKLFSQIVEIQKMIDELDEKLGNYDLVSIFLNLRM